MNKYNRKLHYILISFLTTGKEDTDQHAGYHEPHAAIYPVASYADEKQEAFDFLGPEPGVSCLNTYILLGVYPFPISYYVFQ